MQDVLVAAESDSWGDLLRAIPHDSYHLAGYAQLCGQLEGGRAQAFVATEDDCTLFVPLIVRDVPVALSGGESLRDATVPYGYPGPIVACAASRRAGAPVVFVHRALEALVERLRRERIVSAFFRMHPLLPVDYMTFRRFGPVIQSGETVAIDLTLSDDERWRQMRNNHRRDVTKALTRGETAEVDLAWSGLDAFVLAYRETMARVDADAYYQFSIDYFRQLRDALDGHVHLWTVRSGSEILAGAVFTECKGIVQYHLGGTLGRHLARQPLKLLFHHAAEWFKARGNRWLHLGGGVGSAQDSLLHFKRGFSPLTFPFHTWRLVLDTDAYGALVHRAAAREAPNDPSPSTFFPAYRRRSSHFVQDTA
jgi:hypothetical protein